MIEEDDRMIEEDEEYKKEEIEEDWDFDFSQYDKDDEIDDINLPNINVVPEVLTWRSRYSMGQFVFERIARVDAMVTTLAIEVGMYSNDITVLKRFFSCVSEKWRIIKHIYGGQIQRHVTRAANKALELMSKHHNDTNIPHSVHRALMYLRNEVDKSAQLRNIGMEVDKKPSGIYSKAKRDIVE